MFKYNKQNIKYKLLKDLKVNDTIYYYWKEDGKVNKIEISNINKSFGNNINIKVNGQNFYFTYDIERWGENPVGECNIYLQGIYKGVISTDWELLEDYRDGKFNNVEKFLTKLNLEMYIN